MSAVIPERGTRFQVLFDTVANGGPKSRGKRDIARVSSIDFTLTLQGPIFLGAARAGSQMRCQEAGPSLVQLCVQVFFHQKQGVITSHDSAPGMGEYGGAFPPWPDAGPS